MNKVKRRLKPQMVQLSWLIFFTLGFLSIYTPILGQAQDRIKELEVKLENYSARYPGLRDTVMVALNHVPIREFINSLSVDHKLNVSIADEVSFTMSDNFSNITVREILIFLCKRYELTINFFGDIFIIKEVEKEKVLTPVKEPDIYFNKEANLFTVDLTSDSLTKVLKILTDQSSVNFILSPELKSYKVDGFYVDVPLASLVSNLAQSNGFFMNQIDDKLIKLITVKEKDQIDAKESKEIKKNIRSTNNKSRNTNSNKEGDGYQYHISEEGLISLSGTSILLSEIISTISQAMSINYIFLSEMEEEVTLNLSNIPFDQFLEQVLMGTNYFFTLAEGVFVIGEKKELYMKMFEVVPLKYRTIEDIISYFPSDIKSGIELIEYPDLNCLILAGNKTQVELAKKFINELDKLVPVIQIEVMIVDFTKSKSLTTGVEAGLGQAVEKTNGEILPNFNLNFSTSTINDLINSFNGFGWVKLGQVTPEFYLSIKALEENGVLDLRSTPMLSTLNGHEAQLSIGKTEYYMEETSKTIGTQNPQNETIKTYRPIKADMTVKILPYVSGDEFVTLDITVTQSDFTSRISPDAPPGTVTRDFHSIIRVKDQETILLGGLEEASINESISSVPWIGRVPVLKWFFSSRSKEKSEAKLNVFIKPTIIN